MPSLRPYPSYRKTDLPWLGQIPTHWEVQRAKFIFKKMARPVREEDDVVTAFRDGMVTLRTNRRTEGFTFSIKEIGYQGIRKGDLVIHQMDGFAGAIGVSDSDGKSTPIYSVCVPIIPANTYFYAYLLRQMAKSDFILSLAKGIRERSSDFRFDVFKELDLPIPPLEEQQAIAAYLDRQTAKIDALIAKKERLLELLAEQRAALISQAVTKGLNPNVKMKDSGVESLGKVPQHWNVKRMKYISTEHLQYGANESAEIDDTSLPRFIRITDIREDGTLKDETFKSLPEEVAKPFLLKYGDILFARSGATVGKSFMYRENWGKSCYAGYLIRVRVNPKIAKPEFISYFANSSLYWNWISNIFIKATIQNVSAEKYGNLLLPIPSLSEQEEIVDYLDYQSKQLSDLAVKVETVIERLREYRAALISSVVTGKIDVSEVN